VRRSRFYRWLAQEKEIVAILQCYSTRTRLTKSCSRRLPAVRLHFLWLKQFQRFSSAPSVAALELRLVRPMRVLSFALLISVSVAFGSEPAARSLTSDEAKALRQPAALGERILAEASRYTKASEGIKIPQNLMYSLGRLRSMFFTPLATYAILIWRWRTAIRRPFSSSPLVRGRRTLC